MCFAYFRLKLSAVGKVRSFPQKFSTRKKIMVKKMESEGQGVVRPMCSRLKRVVKEVMERVTER